MVQVGIRIRSRALKFDFLVLLIACAAAVLALGVEARPSAAGTTGRPLTPQSKSGIAGWTTVGSYTENTLYAGEGVATVSQQGHRADLLYRGLASVPSNLKAQGWAHIGDPDSADGYIFDAYQGPSSGKSRCSSSPRPPARAWSTCTASYRASFTTTLSSPSLRTANG